VVAAGVADVCANITAKRFMYILKMWLDNLEEVEYLAS